MQRKMAKLSGFTLIEILIALFIFAILSTIAAIGLRSVIRSYRHVSVTQQRWQRLLIAETLLRQDVSQIVMRSIMNADAHQEPPLMSLNNGFVFTRNGVINPFDRFPRSDLQRVGYVLQDHQLIRLTWQAFDLGFTKKKPDQRVLLKNVEDMNVTFIDNHGKTSSQWPLAYGSNQQVSSLSILPKAIKVTVLLRHQGRLTLVLPLESGRKYAAAQ